MVAHISDTSTGVTYGALGRVVFIPAAHAPARVIARATMIAVSPGGRRVWVQTAVQSMANGVGVSAGFKSPTWAVDLAGRRVSPVLHLPLGLAGATGSGPLTVNLVTRRVQLWNGATGQPIPVNLPADASFVAAGRDRVIWSSRSSPVLSHRSRRLPRRQSRSRRSRRKAGLMVPGSGRATLVQPVPFQCNVFGPPWTAQASLGDITVTALGEAVKFVTNGEIADGDAAAPSAATKPRLAANEPMSRRAAAACLPCDKHIQRCASTCLHRRGYLAAG